MKKPSTLIEVFCGACHKSHGIFPKQEIPKSFICGSCGVGQKTNLFPTVGRTMGNNHNGHELPGGGG